MTLSEFKKKLEWFRTANGSAARLMLPRGKGDMKMWSTLLEVRRDGDRWAYTFRPVRSLQAWRVSEVIHGTADSLEEIDELIDKTWDASLLQLRSVGA